MNNRKIIQEIDSRLERLGNHYHDKKDTDGNPYGEMLAAESNKSWTAGGAVVSDGCLLIQDAQVSPVIDTICWRFSMKMELKKKAPGLVVKLLDENGSSLDIKDFASVSGNVEIYGDLPNRRVFVSLDGKTLKEISLPASFGKIISGFTLESKGPAAEIDDFSLYSFVRTPQTPRMPFVTVLHYDEDFNDVPSMAGWQTASYDDSGWELVTLPSPLGGLKSEGESYYLRTKVQVGDFKYASLLASYSIPLSSKCCEPSSSMARRAWWQ